MNLDEMKLRRLCESKTVRTLTAKQTAKLSAKGKPSARDKTLSQTKPKRQKILRTLKPGGQQVYASMANSESVEAGDSDAEVVIEVTTERNTPAFVRHCVTAITENPEVLARVKKGAPEDSSGSPFAVCWAEYSSNKRGLAAKHSRGKHHTIDQYEKALEGLREDVTTARQKGHDRRSVVFSDAAVDAPTAVSRHLIRYTPRA